MICDIFIDNLRNVLDGRVYVFRPTIFSDHDEEFRVCTPKSLKHWLDGLHKAFQHENVVDRLSRVFDIGLGWNYDQLNESAQ